jgi:hypothetical protein
VCVCEGEFVRREGKKLGSCTWPKKQFFYYLYPHSLVTPIILICLKDF